MGLFKKPVSETPNVDIHSDLEIQQQAVKDMNLHKQIVEVAETHPVYKDGEKPSQYIVRSEINQREDNEDSFHIYNLQLNSLYKPMRILALADGMGGHAYGEQVSREALRKVSTAIFEQLCVDRVVNQIKAQQIADEKVIAHAMWSAIEQANAYIRRMVIANKWGKAGSTILVVAIIGNTAIAINLGDSPLFHYHAEAKQLKKITEDHTVAGALLRAGIITPQMAQFHEGRSKLEFFIGEEKLPRQIPVHTITLSPNDLLLLCSDGVSGMLSHEQMGQILSNPANDLDSIAQQLIDITQKAGETDNQTLILWRQGTGKDEQAVSKPPLVQDPSSNISDSPTIQSSTM